MEESTPLGNNFFRPLLRSGDGLLQHLRRGWGILYRSLGPAVHHLCQVMSLLPFFCLDAELSVGVVVVGRPDLAPSLGGGARGHHAQIRELEKLGRGPGRWVITDDFIPFPVTGVYFDSTLSQRAKGPLQLMVLLSFFGGEVVDHGWFSKDPRASM